MLSRLLPPLSVCTSAILILVSPALGSDTKIYPGSMCRLLNPDQVFEDDLFYDVFGSISNESSRPLHVICPIVRDNSQTTKGIKDVVVFFEDVNFTEIEVFDSFLGVTLQVGDVACALRNASFTGFGPSLGTDFEDLVRSSDPCDDVSKQGVCKHGGVNQPTTFGLEREERFLRLRTTKSLDFVAKEAVWPGAYMLVCVLPPEDFLAPFETSAIGSYLVTEH